jgi:hypothetical protein
MLTVIKKIPAWITCGALYGPHYDIHAAQTGISGTAEGAHVERVYAHAEKYPNEVEHTYSFVQILTACTVSFAHDVNDIGNSVDPWAVICSAWHTGNAAAAKAPVPIWQLAVLSVTISTGLITYGYNTMKGKQAHCSPSIPYLPTLFSQSWATRSRTTRLSEVALWKWAPPSPSSSSRNIPSPSPPPRGPLLALVSATVL